MIIEFEEEKKQKSNMAKNQNQEMKKQKVDRSNLSKLDIYFNKKQTQKSDQIGIPKIKKTEQNHSVASRRKINIKDLSDHLLKNIIIFLSKKDIQTIQWICKSFRTFQQKNLIISIIFKKDIPNDIFIKIMNSIQFVRKIAFGVLKNITPAMFSNNIIWNYQDLECLDLKEYVQMNDTILSIICNKCQKIRSLLVPQFSKISNVGIKTIQMKLKNLSALSFFCKPVNDQIYTFKQNPYIQSEQTIIEILNSNLKSIVKFQIYCVSAGFCQKILESPNIIYEKLTTLKLSFIYLSQECDISVIINSFALFPNLEYLKLLHILSKNETQQKDENINESNFLLILSKCPKLKKLSLGEFTTNSMLDVIAEKINDNLEKLSIFSSKINDDGISHIFAKCNRIKTLNIAKCQRINGYCFEFLASFQIESIKVCFDEYRLKGLKSILQDRSMTKAIITNIWNPKQK